MAAICEIRAHERTTRLVREASVELSRVPTVGERILVFSNADVLCEYEVTSVLHHAKGPHQSREIDATVTVRNVRDSDLAS
jgi:hypothetical protein